MKGTQSIDRAILLMKQIGRRDKTGWALGDLAAECGLTKPTAHRILSMLEDHRLVDRQPDTRHFLPGLMLYELALGRPDSFALLASIELPLRRLVLKFSGVSFVSLRSDTDSVVAATASSLAVKGVQVEVGLRRPMVVTAGGAAMLVAMPRSLSDPIIAGSLEELLTTQSRRVESVKRLIRRSRRAGFGFAKGDIIKGTVSLGVPIMGSEGIPMAALCLASTAEYLPNHKILEAAKLLREEAASLKLAWSFIECENLRSLT